MESGHDHVNHIITPIMVTVKRKPAFALRRTSIQFILLAVLFLVAWTLFLLPYKIAIPAAPSSSSFSDSAPPALRRRRDDIGEILLDGTVTFTPEEFRAGRYDNYVNLPNVPIDPDQDTIIHNLMHVLVPPPSETLLHQPITNNDGRLPPPGGASHNNAIVGLASYPSFLPGWKKLVGSLRNNGYDGHIIVGVNPAIPMNEREYLDAMNVTYYAVEIANCSAFILDGFSDNDIANNNNAVRAKCSSGLEDLKLEWGRYEMARRWLHACETCTGWSMVIDTRDIFFQQDPFASLGDPRYAKHDLLFVEEVAHYTNPLPDASNKHRATNIGESIRYKSHVEPCYGKENAKAYELLDRPMLCSGTVIGTATGIHRFLSVLVDEFRNNNNKGRPECKSPATTDQWTMNYLYYKGKFGFIHKTKTLPWGTGPVLTVGKPCVNSALGEKDGRSQIDMMVMDETNWLVLNPHEREGSDTRIAPTLHQWDRCRDWINPIMQMQMDTWPEYKPTQIGR